MFYWCKLIPNADGTLHRGWIEKFENERELIRGFAYYAMKKLLRFEKVNYNRCAEALQEVLKEQNLTGKDTQRVCLSSSWIGGDGYYNYPVVYAWDWQPRTKQLVRRNGKVCTVADVRNWQDEIIRAMLTGDYGLPKLPKDVPLWWQRQGKTHRKSSDYHHKKNCLSTLRDISAGKVRAKRTKAAFADIKYSEVENNWKSQTKCRHQWERHMAKHQDRFTACFYEGEEYMGVLSEKNEEELRDELDRLERELEYQMHHGRIAELQERISELEKELARRKEG